MSNGNILSGIVWMSGGVGVAAVLNFLFQVMMGNELETDEFAKLVAILGLLSIFSLPLGVFESETAVIISKKNSEGKIDYALNIGHFSPEIKFNIALSIVGMISMFAIFPLDEIRTRMHMIICFGLSINALVMLRVRMGIFQGRKQFRTLAITNVTNSGMKFLSGAVMVWFGLGLESGVFAIFIGFIASIILLFIMKRGISGTQGDTEYTTDGFENRMSIVASLILVGLMLNWDVIVANFALDSEEAGLYSYSAVIAKSVVIASTAIIGVLVPSISESKTSEERFSRFFKLAVIYASMVLPIVAIAYFFEYGILSKIYMNSDPSVYQGPLFVIVIGYSFLSLAQFSVFSSIARLDVKGKIVRMAVTSIIPLFSFFFIEDVERLCQALVIYSVITSSILFGDEIVSLRSKRIITG